MKEKWLRKLFITVLACLLLAQTPMQSLLLTGAITVRADSQEIKYGLIKENGKYYFYQNGKKIKNTWKSVNDGEATYRYYFGSNGAAYMGSKTSGAAVKKINGKTYAFDKNARMVKGVCISKYRFYYFDKKTGVYNSGITKKLRKASKYGKSSKTLRALLKKYAGNPVKTEKTDGCYSKYKDTTCYYKNFLVVYAKTNAGKEVFLEAAAR